MDLFLENSGYMEVKTKGEIIKQPINICGGWCGVCQAFLKGTCDCIKEKTLMTIRCRIKRCAKVKGNPCFKCPEFPCKLIKMIQRSHPNDSRFYARHMWIDNINYLKKYGKEKYKKKLLNDKNMRINPYEVKPKKPCPCKYCRKTFKIELKKG